jgi:hypothetical protein
VPWPTRRHRYQKAVLWPYAGVDRYGQIVRGTPREIRVRWETARSSEDEPDGKSLDLRFQVMVGEEIALESLLWLGSLAEWYGEAGSAGDDAGEEEVCRVVSYTEVPTIKNRHKLRSVSLARFQGAPPRYPTTGDAALGDLTITATGFADAACDDCTDLNSTFTATQSRNEIDTQEWRTAFLELDTGTGTGSFDTEWQIVITRERQANGGVNITARYYRTGRGVVGTYTRTNVTWDGAEPLTLNRGVVDGTCSWPATVTIQGADYVAPSGNVVVEGAGVSAGTCDGCLSLNADFTLAVVVSLTSWRSAATFPFDGAAHVWTAWRTSTQSGLELRLASDNSLVAAWVYAGAWDGLDRKSFSFAGAASPTCCVWPATLAVRGD